MNNNQENKVSMYLTVEKVVNSNKNVWQLQAAYSSVFGNFKAGLGKIRASRLVQEGQITGITKDKQQAKEQAIEKALQVATAVFAYASVTSNHTLQDRVSYSPSDLRYTRDTILIDRLEVIYQAATEYITDLSDYTLTQTVLDEFYVLISAYAAMVEDPREAITNKSRATEELKLWFKETDKILKEQLDKLMTQFKVSNPEFYQHYFNARMIIDLGIRHKKIEESDEEETE